MTDLDKLFRRAQVAYHDLLDLCDAISGMPIRSADELEMGYALRNQAGALLRELHRRQQGAPCH